MNLLRVNSISTVLRKAKQRLKSRPSLEADLAAEILLSHILKLNRAVLYREPERPLTQSQYYIFNHLLKTHLAGKPLAYLTGKKEFMSLDFIVRKTVLIPRPETELLVEEALRLLTTFSETASPSGRFVILDIGTGCGNIAVSVARLTSTRRLKILALDISSEALRIARRNARLHGVGNRITFVHGNLFKAFNRFYLKGKVQLILSNPPYVSKSEYAKLSPSIRRYEPRRALYAGRTGLEFHQRIIKETPDYLKPGGYLLLEMGLGQAKPLQQILANNGYFDNIKVLRDYQGIKRVIIAQRN